MFQMQSCHMQPIHIPISLSWAGTGIPGCGNSFLADDTWYACLDDQTDIDVALIG